MHNRLFRYIKSNYSTVLRACMCQPIKSNTSATPRTSFLDTSWKSTQTNHYNPL